MLHPNPPRACWSAAMRCHAYKSRTRVDTYVFLAAAEGFDVLPDALRRHLGELEPVIEFELTPQRQLPRIEAAQLIEVLAARGYWVQLPPSEQLPE